MLTPVGSVRHPVRHGPYSSLSQLPRMPRTRNGTLRLLLLLFLHCLSHAPVVDAVQPTIFVAPTGSDVPDCGGNSTTACASLRFALSLAASLPVATVSLAPGRYPSSSCNAVNNRTSQLTIVGAGSASTVIDCEGATRGVVSYGTTVFRLQGVTFTRAVASVLASTLQANDCNRGGGAVCVIAGTPDSVSSHHGESGGVVGGVFKNSWPGLQSGEAGGPYSAEVVLTDVSFVENVFQVLNDQNVTCPGASVGKCGVGGGGVLIVHRHGDAHGHTGSVSSGAAAAATSALVSVTNCSFVGNTVASIPSAGVATPIGYLFRGGGGAMGVEAGSVQVTVSDTQFTNNTCSAGDGGGMAIVTLSTNASTTSPGVAVSVGGVVGEGNVAMGTGGAVYATVGSWLGVNGDVKYPASISFDKVTVRGNRAVLMGGGVIAIIGSGGSGDVVGARVTVSQLVAENNVADCTFYKLVVATVLRVCCSSHWAVHANR